MIPFLDLKASYLALQPAIDEAVLRVLHSGYYVGGPEVEDFESAFARYCEATHCAGVGNGLDALVLTLRALDIGPGHEVIVPANTFIATWLAVSQVGATPVPVEPLPSTCNIDPASIEAALTPRTRAIMPVHLYGQPADLDPILAIARAHGLAVIEDAAQAQGATYKGQRIGAHSDAVTWSFYPGKNLGALGDAGAVTSRRADVIERIRLLRNYGSKVKYQHEVQGVNSRLDPIQAAVLRVKLAHLDDWNTRRQAIAERYLIGLQGLPLALPTVAPWATSAWHLFVVHTPERDALRSHLEHSGVQTLIHYPEPPHRQAAYAAQFDMRDDFPLSTQMGRECLSLPIDPQMSMAQVDAVIDAVRRHWV